jgi:hypothetical protein
MGPIIGSISYIVAILIYLLFLFPLGVGLLCGFIIANLIERWKLPDPTVASICGIITGTTAFAAFHFTDYLLYRDTLPLNESGMAMFWTFLQYRAQEGLELGSLFQNFSFQFLSGNEILTWIYWVIEFGLILFAAVFIPRDRAKAPFSHQCQCWYSGNYLGSVPLAYHNQFLELLQTRQVEEARQMIAADTIPPPSLDVYIERCPNCIQEPAILTVNLVSENAKGKLVTQQAYKQEFAPQQWQTLAEAKTTA